MSSNYSELGISADRSVVFDLTDELRLAWERILNEYPAKKGHHVVGYLDGAMAAHNFHKLALRHIMDEAQMDPRQAEAFLVAMRDTWRRAMDEDIAKLRRKRRGGERP